MKKIVTAVYLFATSLGFTQAQETTVDSTSHTQTLRAAQISFIYPLSIAGIDAPKHANVLSCNILAGYNGGVEGFEFGSIANVNEGDVNGVQVAGIVNTNTGGLEGVQVAGICNIVLDSAQGIQVAGISNFGNKGVKGTQIAGIVNHTNGGVQGTQIAGICNSTLDSCRGLQIAGVANVVKGNLDGVQIGLINVTSEEVKGTQIGLINYSKKHSGVQFGLINITDTIEGGIVFGLLSISKNGYVRGEISTTEFYLTSLSLKLGIRKLYSVFSVGTQFIDGKDFNLAFSYGFGAHFPINNMWSFNPELTTSQINYSEAWTNKLNQLNQLQLNVARKIGQRMEIVAGPSLNVYVTQVSRNGEVGTLAEPYTFFEYKGETTSVKMWAGAKVGLRF